jgi:hypothetical protein
MTVDLNRLDTGPESMPWWRTMDNKSKQQQLEVNRFASNSTADYKQLAAGLEGVLKQYQELADYTGRIPTTEVYSVDLNGYGVSSVDYVDLASYTFVIPPGKNFVSVTAQFDLSPNSGQSIYVVNRVTIGGFYEHFGLAYCNGQGSSFLSTTDSWKPVLGGQYTIRWQVKMDSVPVNATINNVANCNALIVYSRV